MTAHLCCLYIMLELLAICGQVIKQGRIVGGYTLAPNSIQYIVSLQSSQGQHLCGGSLVHRFWVLTAAHCNFGLEHVMIVSGDSTFGVYEGTEQYSKPHRLFPHPLYNSSTNNADIMLIKMRVPMVLNTFVSLAPLPRHGTGVTEGRVCRVFGWGLTSLEGSQGPVALMTVEVPIVSTARCNGSGSFNGNITDNMICAGASDGGRDTCKGESGGPLVCRGLVYGVVSWGNGCSDGNFPGVYTAVANFRRWIDRTIYGSYIRCG